MLFMIYYIQMSLIPFVKEVRKMEKDILAVGRSGVQSKLWATPTVSQIMQSIFPFLL